MDGYFNLLSAVYLLSLVLWTPSAEPPVVHAFSLGLRRFLVNPLTARGCRGPCFQHGPRQPLAVKGLIWYVTPEAPVDGAVNMADRNLLNDSMVRLVGGRRASEGRLEIRYNGQWGTVCDDHFDVTDAKVVCRQLGFSGVPEVKPSAAYGKGSGVIWLDELGCHGDENNLFECQHATPVGTHDCEHPEDVGMDCQPPKEVRLVDGERKSSGRVEIKIGGRWGTLCGNGFGTNDARVICRTLGYTRETPAVKKGTYYGSASELVWPTRLACSGHEKTIAECAGLNGTEQSRCTNTEGVGVDCQPSLVPASSPKIRLVNGPVPWAGRPEVYYNNTWGTVCGNLFGEPDATVACRMLGYTSEHAPEVSSKYGRGTGKIWLNELRCRGSETTLFDCPGKVGESYCSYSYSAVGVDCLPRYRRLSVFISGQRPHVTHGAKPLTLKCTISTVHPSVSFRWRGVRCESIITSADFSLCVFTPVLGEDGNVVTCKANAINNTRLSAFTGYTLSLTYPPASPPVITQKNALKSLVDGSNVTLTCSIFGGNPIVTSVDFACEGQGRGMNFTEHQTSDSKTVSKVIEISNLRSADNGAVCLCKGNWTTQPSWYRQLTSMTLVVYPDTEPVISELTLNNAENSLTVTANDNTAVSLHCFSVGRPKPLIQVRRKDTGKIQEGTVSASDLDKDVFDTILTSRRCEDAAAYICEASNRVRSVQKSVTLYVNCPPDFSYLGNETDPALGTPENPVIIKSKDSPDTEKAAFYLTAHPSPRIKRVWLVNSTIELNDTLLTTELPGEEVDNSTFQLHCALTVAVYHKLCTITSSAGATAQNGYYELTIGNDFGEMTIFGKLDATEEDMDFLLIYIGCGVGAAVLIALGVTLVSVRNCRRTAAPQPPKKTYNSPAPDTEAEEEDDGYTTVSMTAVPSSRHKPGVAGTSRPLPSVPVDAKDEDIYENTDGGPDEVYENSMFQNR